MKGNKLIFYDPMNNLIWYYMIYKTIYLYAMVCSAKKGKQKGAKEIRELYNNIAKREVNQTTSTNYPFILYLQHAYIRVQKKSELVKFERSDNTINCSCPSFIKQLK